MVFCSISFIVNPLILKKLPLRNCRTLGVLPLATLSQYWPYSYSTLPTSCFFPSRKNTESLFKRQWVKIRNKVIVEVMANFNQKGASETVVVFGNGNGFTAQANMARNAAESNPSGRHEDTPILTTQQEENEREPNHCMSRCSSNHYVPNGISFDKGGSSPEQMESLATKMDMLKLESLSGDSLANTEPEREALVARKWSQDIKQCEDKSSLGRFHYESLKVMSFNSLARSLVDNKYIGNNSKVMSWNSRKFAILDVIFHANADIVCLQEIDQEEYEKFFLGEFERLGYSSFYKKKKSPKLDGVCILYKQERFECYYHKDVEFAVHDENYNRLQVAVIMALVDKSTQLEGNSNYPVKDLYIIANTHLLFNKNRGDIKFAQLCGMLSAVKDVERRCLEYIGNDVMNQPKPAVIMCGDYNFTPQSLLYHFLSKGYAVIRNCNPRLISGQYLMFEWTYMTEQVGRGKSGITVGNFEGNYISDIYGEGDSNDWAEPLCKAPSIEMFTQMPEWIKRDISLQEVISGYLEQVKKRSTGDDNLAEESSSPCKEETHIDNLEAPDKYLLYCPFNFSSAYSTFDPGLQTSNEPAFTAFHGWQRGCVDYIWYTKDELEVESIYELPSYRDVTARGNLPHEGWPSSDHFSLISQFKRRSS